MQKKKGKLTTSIGGSIDRMSYGSIAIIIVVLLLVCATYFWLLSPHHHGTNKLNIGWLDSLYYCIVTFSSLGYGDITPTGFGKVVASFQIVSGLILTAIFIGKIASERQSAMLRLVYTSEHQRRLIEFEKEIYNLCDQIEVSLNNHDHDTLNKQSKEIYRFLASIHNYLNFQAHQGGLASFGNTSSLKRLYKSIAELQLTIYEAIRTYGVQENTLNRFKQLIERINKIAQIMYEFHQDDKKVCLILEEITRMKHNIDRWYEKLNKGTAEYKYRSELSEYLLAQVLIALPPRPWPNHVHKIVAIKLRIQNALAQKCISKLIRDKRV